MNEFHCKYNVYYLFIYLFIFFLPYEKWMCPVCVICAKQRLNSAHGMYYAQMCHYHVGHLRAWKDYLTDWKILFAAWKD